jgi:hypothetical protein
MSDRVAKGAPANPGRDATTRPPKNRIRLKINDL